MQVGFGLYPVVVKTFAAKNNANPLIFSLYRYIPHPDICTDHVTVSSITPHGGV